MKRRSLTTIFSVACVAAATVGLPFAGASAASADTVAPPTAYTNVGSVGFLVPSPDKPGSGTAHLEGSIFAHHPSLSDVSLTLWCSSSRSYPVNVTATPGSLDVRAELPLTEVGDLCFLNSAPVNGRVGAFGDAGVVRDGGGKFGAYFWGELLTRSSTGGL